MSEIIHVLCTTYESNPEISVAGVRNPGEPPAELMTKPGSPGGVCVLGEGCDKKREGHSGSSTVFGNLGSSNCLPDWNPGSITLSFFVSIFSDVKWS